MQQRSRGILCGLAHDSMQCYSTSAWICCSTLRLPVLYKRYASQPACLVNIGGLEVVRCAGARLSVSLSATSVNAASAVAERAATAAPVDTSKKPKELGFTMPGAFLDQLTPWHMLGVFANVLSEFLTSLIWCCRRRLLLLQHLF